MDRFNKGGDTHHIISISQIITDIFGQYLSVRQLNRTLKFSQGNTKSATIKTSLPEKDRVHQDTAGRQFASLPCWVKRPCLPGPLLGWFPTTGGVLSAHALVWTLGYTHTKTAVWKVRVLTSVTKNKQFGALSKPIASQNQRVGPASFTSNRQRDRYSNSELLQEIM